MQSGRSMSLPVANYLYFAARHVCGPVHAALTELFKPLYIPGLRTNVGNLT